MYQIHTRKSPNGKVDFQLQFIPAAKIPMKVLAGTGDKKARYKAYLEKCFQDNENLLRLMAYIHLQGTKLGDVCLISDIKRYPYHAVCIKEFVEAHAEQLDFIVPYLFPGEKTAENADGANVPEELKAKLAEQNIPPIAGSKMTLADLPEDDRNQIMALIAADQQTQTQQAAPQVIPITVGDGEAVETQVEQNS